MKKLFKKYPRFFWSTMVVLSIIYWQCLPNPIFVTPTSMVLEDKDGLLIGARIAADGQWRFPYQDSLPDKFIQCITEFEDRRFFYHPGIDPVGMGRAIQQNIKHKKIVSGGSTISMQIIRLSRKGKARSIFQKIIELILATRLEIGYSKNEILALYAANAPFGGNVVGLEAASWRYYGKKPDVLSWAESAMLAVLPNSPSLIHPGKNREALEQKRNRLLERLYRKNAIDSLSYVLAKEEALPEKPHPLPRLAPHLLDRVYVENFDKKSNVITRLQTTIDGNLQERVLQIISKHHYSLKGNGIHNAAAIVLDIETGNVLAYVGNIPNTGYDHAEAVDIIQAPRSTGSILKPFLYAMMLQEGKILPNSLISDTPMQLGGYRPENFHRSYDGVVSAKKALVRSLNVPTVRMLQQYGVEKFHFGLRQIGLSTITKLPDYYGLPLVLGGAETTLWEITNAYTCMARTLHHFQTYNSQYDKADFRPPNYFYNKEPITTKNKVDEAPVISAAASWFTFEAMKTLERPNSEGEWQQFHSRQPIAWKTGTSFGFRDAWAVGVNGRYAVGVWAGNADGEGRPGLIGVLAAAPILFDIFQLLPFGEWYSPPYDGMQELAVCQKSGYRALAICEADTVWCPNAGIRASPCTFHQLVHLDESEDWQVNSTCLSPGEMRHRGWFVLPPTEEFYYKNKYPDYKMLPPFRADCQSTVANKSVSMQFIYPEANTQIYVPVNLDGTLSKAVFKLAHRVPETTVYWHLDNEYVGTTTKFHQLELAPTEGQHQITAVDEKGERVERYFEVIGKDEKR